MKGRIPSLFGERFTRSVDAKDVVNLLEAA
jgi:hypothetical protein